MGLAALTGCAPPAPAAAPETHPAPIAPPAVAPEPQRPRYDVLVVGAGMAGITAARTLVAAHLKVLVLEATKRVGGRGITTEALGKGTFSVPIDLGGAWIHGVKTNPLTPIVVGSGYKTERTHVDASEHFFFKGHFANVKERDELRDAVESYEEDLKRTLDESGDDAKGSDGKLLSAGDVLGANKKMKKLDRTLRRVAELNVGPLEAAVELSQSSIEDSALFISEDDDFLRDGYGTFVESYAADLRPLVRLETPVQSIARTATGVVVKAGGETFEARKVLVTVSTGVLAAGKIAFDPPLPAAKLDAIRALPMGVLDKVILEFDTPSVFPTDGGKTLENTWLLYGGADAKGREDLALVLQPMKTNIVVGFFGGDYAKELERQPDHGRPEMIRIAMKAMTEMCKASKPKAEAGKCDLERARKAAVTTAWNSEPWTLGSYSAAAPGGAKMREALAEPIEHTLYFAGEAAYNATYNGSFAAAYNSGLRSARAIADCLGREDEQPPRACVWYPMTRTDPKR